ncbi:hypothetical protein E1176_12390, partial [Fulvivirga sp. RKSG066]|uniref:hypothetical protein n=1 Tax=Fulvivirga aurantia TaxID=2529383 RepID=UPI0012BBF5C8
MKQSKEKQNQEVARHPDKRMRNSAQRDRMNRAVDPEHDDKDIEVISPKSPARETTPLALEQKPEETNDEGDKKVKDPEPDHPYMQVLGWGQSRDWTIFGTSYTTRFIYKGKAADWKKLLATLDDDRSVIKYLAPFFAAVGCGSGSVRYNVYAGDYTEAYHYKDATPSQEDILELIKALYDTESSKESTIDLPNEFWTEGGSNIPRFYDMGFDGLAEFISQYQTLLIDYKSAQIGNVSLEYADAKKLATEGTRWSDVQINDPKVVEAMIDNAFATALAAVKKILANQTDDKEGDATQNKEDIHASMMITNSAKIISAAIDSYGATTLKANKSIKTVFDQVWDLIPIPKTIPKLLEDS